MLCQTSPIFTKQKGKALDASLSAYVLHYTVGIYGILPFWNIKSYFLTIPEIHWHMRAKIVPFSQRPFGQQKDPLMSLKQR